MDSWYYARWQYKWLWYNQKIRENDTKTPVIFTSARDQELDKIIGLELGSDDYITKPYSPKELMLRIANILKRVYNDSNKVKYEDYEVDIEKEVFMKVKRKLI